MNDEKKKCENCFHMVRYMGSSDKGWCGNHNSPNENKDIAMTDSCDEWNKREPFEW